MPTVFFPRHSSQRGSVGSTIPFWVYPIQGHRGTFSPHQNLFLKFFYLSPRLGSPEADVESETGVKYTLSEGYSGSIPLAGNGTGQREKLNCITGQTSHWSSGVDLFYQKFQNAIRMEC